MTMRMCTAINFLTPDGKINFASNLDYGFVDFAEGLTFNAQIYDQDKLLFEGLYVFGQIGFVRYHNVDQNYAIALNARNNSLDYPDFIKGLK